MSWKSFFGTKLSEILEESAFEYAGYKVTYNCDASNMLNTNVVSKNKVTPIETLKVDVVIESTKANDKFAKVKFKDVGIIKLPILTESGFIIRGTRYACLKELKPADGWYILDNSSKSKIKEEIKENSQVMQQITENNKKITAKIANELASSINNSIPMISNEAEAYEQLIADEKDEEINDESFIDRSDESITEELEELDEEILNTKEHDKINNLNSDYNTDIKHELFDTECFNDATSAILTFRASFGRSLDFYVANNNNVNQPIVRFRGKNGIRKVGWFAFFRCLFPQLSVEEIFKMYSNFDIIKEAYIQEIAQNSTSGRGVNIYSSPERCASYLLTTLFGNKLASEKSNGVFYPLDEVHARLNNLRCNTLERNRNIYSFTRLENLELAEEIDNNLSSEDKDTVIYKLGHIQKGTKLTVIQLAVLDKLESLKEIKVKKNNKVFSVYKPPVRNNFIDEIVDMFYNYLLITEGVGITTEKDAFENKIVESIEEKIENSIKKILNNFELSFREENLQHETKDSNIMTNYAKCFTVDIDGNYRNFLKRLQSDPYFQGKDDTNSLGTYGQGQQVKFASSSDVPASVREVRPDQYGLICPASSSEGANIGLNLYQTFKSIVEDSILKKPFYVIKNGCRLKDEKGEDVIEYLSAGQISRSIIVSIKNKLPNDPTERCRNAYIGNRRVKVAWNLIEYQEISESTNISSPLASTICPSSNGGKRPTMAVSTTKQVYPVLNSHRPMVTSGIIQEEEVGITRCSKFIEESINQLGLTSESVNMTGNEYVSILATEQCSHECKIHYIVEGNPILQNREYIFSIPCLTSTIKMSLKHAFINIKRNNMYFPKDIIVYMNDIDITPIETEGDSSIISNSTASEFDSCVGMEFRIAFLCANGYNYEDAQVFTEELVGTGRTAIVRTFPLSMEICEGDGMTFGNPTGIPHLDDRGLPKLGSYLKPGDIAICKAYVDSQGKSKISPLVMAEGKKDRGRVISAELQEYMKDNVKYTRATITLEYVSNSQDGDKFTGGHGNKGVAARHSRFNECFYIKETGELIDGICNPTGVLPRNNIGQFKEAIYNEIGHARGKVQLVSAFDGMDLKTLLDTAEINGIEEVEIVNGFTGRVCPRKVLVARMIFYRSEHDVKGKFKATDGSSQLNANTMTVSKGVGQRVGELSVAAILGSGAYNVLDSYFTIQGSDVIASESYVKSECTVEPEAQNILNMNPKVLYRLDGVEFEDWNRGTFKVITDDMVNCDNSRFITTDSYDINDREIYGNPDQKSTIMTAKLREFGYSRMVSLKGKFIYPQMLNSEFVRWNMWYIPSDASDDKSILLSVIRNAKENSEKSMVIDKLRHLSMQIINQLLMGNSRKSVVWVKGYNIPFIIDTTAINANPEYRDRDLVVIERGYASVISVMLGVNYINNENGEKFEDVNSGKQSVLYNIILAYLATALENKFDCKSTDIRQYTANDFAGAILREQPNNEKLLNFVKAIQELAKDYNGKEKSKEINLYTLVTGKNSGFFEIIKAYLNNFELDFNSLNDLYTISDISVHDVFEKVSCSYIWIPPMAYRKELMGGIPSKIQQCLTTVINQVKSYENNSSTKNSKSKYMSLVYLGLSNLHNYVIDKMKNHSTKNAELRDLTVSVRLRWSGRGYIIPDRTLKMDQCGIPITIAAGIFATHLTNSSLYPKDSLFYSILDMMLDRSKRRRKDMILYLTASNPESFIRELQHMEAHDRVIENACKILGLSNTDNIDSYEFYMIIYKRCLKEMKDVISNLLLKYPITLSRAPELWQYSRNSYWGVLTEGYAIKLCPLSCKPFNADFDGDQMAADICETQAGREDQVNILMPSKRIICATNGKPLPNINQDMILGLYSATIERENKLTFWDREDLLKYNNSLSSKLKARMEITKNKDFIKNNLCKPIQESECVFTSEENPIAIFTNLNDMIGALDNGLISSHDYVKMTYEDTRGLGKSYIRSYVDTVGRIIVNSILPKELGYTNIRYFNCSGERILAIDARSSSIENLINDEQTKEYIANLKIHTIALWRQGKYHLISTNLDELSDLSEDIILKSIECYPITDHYELATKVLGYTYLNTNTFKGIIKVAQQYSEEEIADFLNKSMDLGFAFACYESITLSLLDFKPIVNDQKIKTFMKELENKIDLAEDLYLKGYKTEEEYSTWLQSIVGDQKNDIADYLRENLDRNSNIFILIDSGARGDFTQLTELSVMVGIPLDTDGNPILDPILTGYAEGLSSRSYHSVSYYGRKALIIGAISTGQIGAVSRELIYTTDHSLITTDQCDVKSQLVPLKYEVHLPNSLDLKTCVFLEQKDNPNWNNLINEWKYYEDSYKQELEKSEFKRIGVKRYTTPLTISLFKQLCQKHKVNNIVYIDKVGNQYIESISYTMTDRSKKTILLRSVDVDLLCETYNFNTKTLSYIPDGKYFVVSDATIKEIEKHIITEFPMYLVMYCKNEIGICRRCYGADVTLKAPKYMYAGGIVTSQSMGQVTTQVALNAHKSKTGKSISSFTTVKNFLAQHNLGDIVCVAPEDGTIDILSENDITRVYLITCNGVIDLFYYREGTMKLEINRGDAVHKGDILYSNGILNYEMYAKKLSKYRINMEDVLLQSRLKGLYFIYEIYENEDILVRHFDILMRELTKFGASKKTLKVGDRIFCKNCIYPINDMLEHNIPFDPLEVSTQKSMQLNNKGITSQTHAYLNAQLGDDAVAQRTSSLFSPFSALLRSVKFAEIYKVVDNMESIDKEYYNSLSLKEKEEYLEEKIAKTYAERYYGSITEKNTENIKQKFETKRIKQIISIKQSVSMKDFLKQNNKTFKEKVFKSSLFNREEISSTNVIKPTIVVDNIEENVVKENKKVNESNSELINKINYEDSTIQQENYEVSNQEKLSESSLF